MALTNQQREEMRKCIIGPCSEREKQTIRDGLDYLNEPLVSSILWIPTRGPIIKHGIDKWKVVGNLNRTTISAKDFISKYLSDATK